MQRAEQVDLHLLRRHLRLYLRGERRRLARQVAHLAVVRVLEDLAEPVGFLDRHELGRREAELPLAATRGRHPTAGGEHRGGDPERAAELEQVPPGQRQAVATMAIATMAIAKLVIVCGHLRAAGHPGHLRSCTRTGRKASPAAVTYWPPEYASSDTGFQLLRKRP
ncbi:MAG: hypothetical protein ACRDTM_02900 [Micromonosporaceae bacterium]